MRGGGATFEKQNWQDLISDDRVIPKLLALCLEG